MKKALKIFIPTLLIVLFLNQMAYGSCFEGYCLAAAFPKVTILSVIISAFIYWVSKSEESGK
jgi:hypothetical protein